VAEAIPTIPLEKINAFLLSNASSTRKGLRNAPYMVAGDADRVVSGAGDRAYARGRQLNEEGSYGIFRQGKVYTDPDTKEVLGIDAMDIGSAKSSPPKATSPR
jgi:nucleoid-associated protein YgaU